MEIVLITHEAVEVDIQTALEEIKGQSLIAGRTQLIRIEGE